VPPVTLGTCAGAHANGDGGLDSLPADGVNASAVAPLPAISGNLVPALYAGGGGLQGAPRADGLVGGDDVAPPGP
jgi:hypothetical protein